MISNDAIRNNIREGKTYQIDSTIATSIQEGMCPLDFYLAEPVKKTNNERYCHGEMQN